MGSQKSFLPILMVLFLIPTVCSAFHDGGVASCNSCHTMHISQNGGPMYHWNPNGNQYLLLYGNATDTCLMCHSSRGTFDYGEGHGAGGDFYWVTKNFSWTTPWGTEESSVGDSHGHNVISSFFNIDEDATLSQAPGGSFQSSELGCTSCHDPHGNTNFRMLYDSTLGPVYEDTRFEFLADAPLAIGNSITTSAGSSGAESNSNHTVYKSGMSEWCANCHPEFHSDNSTNFIHPVGDPMGVNIAAIYNAYTSTDDPSSGSQLYSYSGLVPFEAVNVDLNLVDPSDYTLGPDSGDMVMCLTCHRSHASPFRDAGRWDFLATLTTRIPIPR